MVNQSLAPDDDSVRASESVRHACVSFDFDDPFVSDQFERVNAEVDALARDGFFGDHSVDLFRKRTSRIDFANPATKRLLSMVPTVEDWLNLVPSASALDPLYRPEAEQLPTGAEVGPELREWFRNIADARGIRSRAAVYQSIVREKGASGPAEQRWLSLACGAAQPVLDAAASVARVATPPPSLTLVDLDKDSLQLAARYADERALGDSVRLQRANVLDRRGLRAPQPAYRFWRPFREGSFDVVEAIGLLEYLKPDDWAYTYGRVIAARRRLAGARSFLRNAYRLVRPGGMLIVGNMLDTHPQLGFTLNVVQWPHIQPRSVDAMLALIREAGISEFVNVVLPRDGVYAMYSVEKV